MLAPRAAVCAERIGEVLDTESSVVLAEHPVDRAAGGLEVRFDDAEFTYPGRGLPVLCDVTLHRPAGPDHGDHRLDRVRQDHPGLAHPAAVRRHRRVGRVDGVDVRDWSPRRCGAGSAWCRSGRYLFTGTVASNLRYGKPDATDEELWEALRVAQADDFVAAMAGQLEAPIAQGGTNVSGGQRQRLVHRPGVGEEARDLRLRRLVLRPGRGHRRAVAGRAESRDRRRLRDHRRPAGGHDRATPTRSWCSRTAGSSAAAPMTSCWRPARPTRRSSTPS